MSPISEGEATTRLFSALQTFEPVTATALLIPSIIDATPSTAVLSSLPTSASTTGRVFSTDPGSSSSGTTCQTCQSISGTGEIPSVSTTPASMGLVGTGVASNSIATPASRDVSGTGRGSDSTTSVSQGRVGTGGALGISASSSGSPIQATNGSWSFSKSGWTIAPTSVAKIIHTVHSDYTEGVTSTIDQKNLVSTNTHPAPQTELNSKDVTSKPTRKSNGLAPSIKMSPSSGTGAGVPSTKPSSFTGVASNLREQLSIWLIVLLAFSSILLVPNTH